MRGGLLHLPAAGAELQQLAVRLAGRFPDHDALPRVAQGIHVASLLDLPAVRAEIAVIAQGQAGSRSLVQQDEVVVLPAALITAAVPAAVLLPAAAVGIPQLQARLPSVLGSVSRSQTLATPFSVMFTPLQV